MKLLSTILLKIGLKSLFLRKVIWASLCRCFWASNCMDIYDIGLCMDSLKNYQLSTSQCERETSTHDMIENKFLTLLTLSNEWRDETQWGWNFLHKNFQLSYEPLGLKVLCLHQMWFGEALQCATLRFTSNLT